MQLISVAKLGLSKEDFSSEIYGRCRVQRHQHDHCLNHNPEFCRIYFVWCFLISNWFEQARYSSSSPIPGLPYNGGAIVTQPEPSLGDPPPLFISSFNFNSMRQSPEIANTVQCRYKDKDKDSFISSSRYSRQSNLLPGINNNVTVDRRKPKYLYLQTQGISFSFYCIPLLLKNRRSQLQLLIIAPQRRYTVDYKGYVQT